jgi:hypothetical protein
VSEESFDQKRVSYDEIDEKSVDRKQGHPEVIARFEGV